MNCIGRNVKKIGLKIPLGFRFILFVTLTVSWFTGVGFFLLETFFQIDGEFGTEKHPWQTPALSVHGGAAFLMMVWFGSLLSAHVPRGWETKRLRYWGLSLVGALTLQIITAYALYYSAHELTHIVVKWMHIGIGVSLPAILTGHILAGRKHRKNLKRLKTKF